MKLGIELELVVLLIVQTVLTAAFAKFEAETAPLKKMVKWFAIYSITIACFFFFGHWALLCLLLMLIPGTIYHFFWCRKHGIHPLKATPRKKYYKLRNWKWEE